MRSLVYRYRIQFGFFCAIVAFIAGLGIAQLLSYQIPEVPSVEVYLIRREPASKRTASATIVEESKEFWSGCPVDAIVAYANACIEEGEISPIEDSLPETFGYPNVVLDTENLITTTMYINATCVNYRTYPVITKETVIDILHYGDSVEVVEPAYDSWYLAVVDEDPVYIYCSYLQETVPFELDKVTPASVGHDVLTARAGRVLGPSGQETYYNLDMSGCVKRMHRLGYDMESWVRDDGVKMLGDYIMIAADFSIRPLGTLVETSLGTGIVVDTGDFVKKDKYAIDIATTW